MKLTLTEIPVFTLGYLRMAGASIILLPFCFRYLHIKKEDYKTFILVGLLGTNLNLAFFFAGLKLSTAINSAIISSAIPIFTLLGAYLFLKEKLTAKLIYASIVSFLGILLIVGLPILKLEFRSTLGDILLILATLSWIGYEIYAKILSKTYNAKTVTFYTAAIGALAFFPGFTAETIQNPAWAQHLTAAAIFGLFYGIVFSSALGYYFWQKGLSLLSAGEASFFFYLDPISGIIFSMLLLGEQLSLPIIVGGILIVSGVFLAENHRRTHPLLKKVWS